MRDARAWREVQSAATAPAYGNKSYGHHSIAAVPEVPPAEVAAREVAAVEVSSHYFGPVEIGSSEHRPFSGDVRRS